MSTWAKQCVCCWHPVLYTLLQNSFTFHPQQPYYIVCTAASECVLSKTADFRMHMFISAAYIPTVTSAAHCIIRLLSYCTVASCMGKQEPAGFLSGFTRLVLCHVEVSSEQDWNHASQLSHVLQMMSCKQWSQYSLITAEQHLAY